ncbi:MAG: NUDIX domain-containing protein [Lachnospiraceae bacterium]|nr:NUDIX domain-containing protein [Lachnospiraceae bacterium]
MYLDNFELLKVNDVKPAAIIIPTIVIDNEKQLLLEVRSANIRQALEVCFPGGRINENESPKDAAIRELKEELLIEDDKIFNVKEVCLTIGPRLEPIFVYECELRSYSNTYSTDEVSELLIKPYSFFKDNVIVKPNERQKTQYEYQLDGHTIWGLTARVINYYMNR